MTSECAMCGEPFRTPYTRYDVPPICLDLMQNAGGIDTDAVAGKVHVGVCEECSTVARKMVTEYDTSPLPECDATATSWNTTGVVEAFAGSEVDTRDDLTERMATDALATVAAATNDDAAPIPESKVAEAFVVATSLEQLDVIDTDTVGETA